MYFRSYLNTSSCPYVRAICLNSHVNIINCRLLCHRSFLTIHNHSHLILSISHQLKFFIFYLILHFPRLYRFSLPVCLSFTLLLCFSSSLSDSVFPCGSFLFYRLKWDFNRSIYEAISIKLLSPINHTNEARNWLMLLKAMDCVYLLIIETG